LPRYFGNNGYSSPNDYLSGPFQYGHNTEMETYSYWLTQPDVIDNFNIFMQGGKLKKTRKWTGQYRVPLIYSPRLTAADWFPTKSVIVNGAKATSDGILLVDIAGGRVRGTVIWHDESDPARVMTSKRFA
jgi:hypothetical protein